MKQQELIRYARIGAQARLETLQREIDGLLRQFPGLSRGSAQGKGRLGKAAAEGGASPKRNMSPAARKRISDAAKKRWTEWRKKNKRD